MATKLKNLKITSVDFVNAGANPDAHIRLFKSKEDKPSLLDRFKNIFKGQTYSEERSKDRIRDEMFSMTCAFNQSMLSIICDETLDGNARLDSLKENFFEYSTEVTQALEKWANLQPYTAINKATSDERIKALIAHRDELNEIISQYEDKQKKPEEINDKKDEEENKDMKIDKSKMSKEELDFLDSIEKKYGCEKEEPEKNDPKPDEKTNPNPEEDPKKEEKPPVEKSQDPAVAKALAEVEAIKKSLELDKMTLVAKKYEILGKDPVELAKSLADIKNSSETAYTSYIEALDAHLNTVQETGVFKELGSSASGNYGKEWADVEKAATEIRKSNPNLTREQAIDKACMDNPSLAQAYEKSLS